MISFKEAAAVQVELSKLIEERDPLDKPMTEIKRTLDQNKKDLLRYPSHMTASSVLD